MENTHDTTHETTHHTDPLAGHHETTDVPYDLYETPQEIVVIMPLWWVTKESIRLSREQHHIRIEATRSAPTLKDGATPRMERAFWWPFAQRIELPQIPLHYQDVVSRLSPENILTVIIPKSIQPEQIALHIE